MKNGMSVMKMWAIILAVILAYFFGRACEERSETMGPEMFLRYGMEKGYGEPVNVEDRNGRLICILWPDGKLERSESWEMICRTLMARNIAAVAAVRDERAIIAKYQAKVAALQNPKEVAEEKRGWSIFGRGK